MGNCITDWVFRRQKFCCCLPARLGAALLAGLTMLIGGLLTIVLWFEVRTDYFMSGREKAAFIVAGLMETFLFIASILGFIGTCARKQSFVTTYALFLYFHLVINIIVAAYFLIEITSTANNDITKLCENSLRADQSKDQCKGLLNITKDVFWAAAILVLSIETYCTIVVTRYVNQLRYEKRDVRRSRIMQRQSAYDAFHARFGSFGSLDSGKLSPNDRNLEDGLPMGARDKQYSAIHRSSSDEDMDMDKEGLLNEPPVQHRAFDPYENEIYAYDASFSSRSPKFVLGDPPVTQSARQLNVSSGEGAGDDTERRISTSSDGTLTPTPGTARPNANGVSRLSSSSTLEAPQSRSTSPLPPGAAPAVLRP